MNCYQLIVVLIVIFILILFIGAAGYHKLFDLNLVDSFYTAASTMTGLSQEVLPETNDQKIFIATYALLSIAFYLILVAAIIAIILEPIILSSKHDNNNKFRLY